MIGKHIGQYEVIEILGSGETGVVYRGRDHLLKRDVAIKVIKPNAQQEDVIWERFELGAQAASRLIHPNIVSVIDYGVEAGVPYLVMTYLPGRSLKGRPAIPLGWEQAIQKLVPVARALAYAHHEGITHQGIKMSNLMVTESGDLVLTDFGITRLVAPKQSLPELVDPRDDIDHFASVFFGMLTGQEIDPIDLSQPLNEDRIRELNLPEAIENLLFKAFHENPEQRYQTMGEFIQAMEDLPRPDVGDFLCGENLSTSQEDNLSEKGRESATKPWIWLGSVVLFTGLIGVVCVGGALWGVFQSFGSFVLARNDISNASPTAKPSTPTPEYLEPSLPTKSETMDIPSVAVPQTDTPQLPTATIESTPSPSPSLSPTPTITPTPLGGGGWIAFHSNRSGNNDIYVMRIDGGDLRQLTHENADDRAPSWSPDGGSIAYKSNLDGDYEIYILDLLTGNRWQVTSNDCNDHSPVWSPDGRQFVFYSECDGNREIYVIDADGENQIQLTETSGVYNWFAVWSPDGRQIAFSSNRNGKYQVFLMNADGSNPQALVDGCVPYYSPDGKKIVFNQYCTDSGNIWVMNADGSDAHPLTEAPMDNNRNPSWSADSMKIVFQSEQSGNFEIWMMDADGSDWVQLTDHPATDVAPVWQPSAITWGSP